MKFNNNNKMQVHFDTCTLEQKDVFNKSPQLWEKRRNVIKELADYNDVDVDFKYDYIAIFDFESILENMEQKVDPELIRDLESIIKKTDQKVYPKLKYDLESIIEKMD